MSGLKHWLLASLALAAGACSSTSKKNLGPCGNESDGCISASVTNADPSPYGAGGELNGMGNLYLALLDQCPSPTSQFSFVSDATVIADVDLTSSASYRGTVSYSFDDARFSVTYSAGETAYLTGFLDDNDTVTDITAPYPDNGDTLVSCVPVVLQPGKTARAAPLTPCFTLENVSPHVFMFSMDCEAYDPFLATVPDAGTDAGN